VSVGDDQDAPRVTLDAKSQPGCNVRPSRRAVVLSTSVAVSHRAAYRCRRLLSRRFSVCSDGELPERVNIPGACAPRPLRGLPSYALNLAQRTSNDL
jgi:hypothetical protein